MIAGTGCTVSITTELSLLLYAVCLLFFSDRFLWCWSQMTATAPSALLCLLVRAFQYRCFVSSLYTHRQPLLVDILQVLQHDLSRIRSVPLHNMRQRQSRGLLDLIRGVLDLVKQGIYQSGRVTGLLRLGQGVPKLLS